MFDKPFFGFDADKMTEMFTAPDMTKMFEAFKAPAFDTASYMETGKKNMDALVAANKAAAAGYQDLFKKQVTIFEETMAAAQTQMSELKMDALSPEGAEKQAELMKAAFDKSIENMTALAEAAKKANEEAFQIVQARVNESISEFQDAAKKFGA